MGNSLHKKISRSIMNKLIRNKTNHRIKLLFYHVSNALVRLKFLNKHYNMLKENKSR